MNIFIALIFWIFVSVEVTLGAPKPTPTPRTRPPTVRALPADITAADITKTEQHRDQLINQLQADLDAEKADHLKVSNALATATEQNATLQKQIDAQTAKLNQVQADLDSARKKLFWYRIHFFLGWVIFITGVIACIILFVLKVTGRLAILGTAVASKIP